MYAGLSRADNTGMDTKNTNLEYVKHEPGPYVQEGRTDAFLNGELVAKLHKAEVVSSRAKAGRLLVDGRMATKWAADCAVPDCTYRTYGRTREEAVKDILRHRQDVARMQVKGH
jgi:hypothetical protein